MKIRIIEADKTKWYSNKIGKVYRVKTMEEFEGIICFVIRNYRTILRTVDFDDAEIILEI